MPSVSVPQPTKVVKARQLPSSTDIAQRRDDRVRDLKAAIHPKSYSIFDIPYDLLKLEKEKLTPCYFDMKDEKSRAEVQCICSDSRRFQKDPKDMIACSECQKLSHLKCAGKNAKMKHYICAICQLVSLDPYSVPLISMLPPFIVYKYNDANENER